MRRIYLHLSRLPQLASAILLSSVGLVVMHCDWFTDNPPPALHKLSLDTTWTDELYRDSSARGPLNRADSIETEIRRDTLKTLPNDRSKDSLKITAKVIHFELYTATLYKVQVRNGFEIETDSGPETAPFTTPVEKNRQPISVRTTENLGTIPDTNFIDTVTRIRLKLLRNSDDTPQLTALPLNDTLRLNLEYPAYKLGPLPITAGANLDLELDTDSWPGEYRFNSTHDSLTLYWPGVTSAQIQNPAGDTTLNPGDLGLLRGTLVLKKGLIRSQRVFVFNRAWHGFYPGSKSLLDRWRIAQGNPQAVGKEAGVDKRITIAMNAPGKDSLVRLQSLFQLEGDFDFSVKLRRPIEATSGSLNAISLSNSEPFVYFTPTVGNKPAHFDFNPNETGVWVNYNGQSYPETYCFGVYEGNSLLKFTYYYIEWRVKKIGNVFTYYMREATSTPWTLVREFAPSVELIPNQLPIQLVTGSYSKKTFSFEWEDFTITQGKVVKP